MWAALARCLGGCVENDVSLDGDKRADESKRKADDKARMRHLQLMPLLHVAGLLSLWLPGDMAIAAQKQNEAALLADVFAHDPNIIISSTSATCQRLVAGTAQQKDQMPWKSIVWHVQRLSLFLAKMLELTRLPYEHIFLSCILIRRLLRYNPGFIDLLKQKSGSELRVATVALMLATKVLSDNSYTNPSFAVASGFGVLELSQMELEFLVAIRFNLYVSRREYRQWLRLLHTAAEECANHFAISHTVTNMLISDLNNADSNDTLNMTPSLSDTSDMFQLNLMSDIPSQSLNNRYLTITQNVHLNSTSSTSLSRQSSTPSFLARKSSASSRDNLLFKKDKEHYSVFSSINNNDNPFHSRPRSSRKLINSCLSHLSSLQPCSQNTQYTPNERYDHSTTSDSITKTITLNQSKMTTIPSLPSLKNLSSLCFPKTDRLESSKLNSSEQSLRSASFASARSDICPILALPSLHSISTSNSSQYTLTETDPPPEHQSKLMKTPHTTSLITSSAKYPNLPKSTITSSHTQQTLKLKVSIKKPFYSNSNASSRYPTDINNNLSVRRSKSNNSTPVDRSSLSHFQNPSSTSNESTSTPTYELLPWPLSVSPISFNLKTPVLPSLNIGKQHKLDITPPVHRNHGEHWSTLTTTPLLKKDCLSNQKVTTTSYAVPYAFNKQRETKEAIITKVNAKYTENASERTLTSQSKRTHAIPTTTALQEPNRIQFRRKAFDLLPSTNPIMTQSTPSAAVDKELIELMSTLSRKTREVAPSGPLPRQCVLALMHKSNTLPSKRNTPRTTPVGRRTPDSLMSTITPPIKEPLQQNYLPHLAPLTPLDEHFKKMGFDDWTALSRLTSVELARTF